MARGTKIEWATATWNPFIGCTKVSPACDNCYAEGWAKRCGRNFSHVDRAAAGTFYAPLKWKKPERIFVCSLSDFFHDDISWEDRWQAFDVMETARQHTYMLLTKRPENIMETLRSIHRTEGLPENVWVGVTVENQEQADRRIPLLLQVPAKMRFVSCEPLLGPVDIAPYLVRVTNSMRLDSMSLGGDGMLHADGEILSQTPRLNWVICGGESGGNARPVHPAWARSLRDQCAAAGVPFMFKQWGESIAHPVKDATWGDGTPVPADAEPVRFERVGKVKAGRLLDGREHLEVPE